MTRWEMERYLFWMPPQDTEFGRAPGFYMEAKGEDERQMLVAVGGQPRDHDEDHRAYDRQCREEQEALL